MLTSLKLIKMNVNFFLMCSLDLNSYRELDQWTWKSVGQRPPKDK